MKLYFYFFSLIFKKIRIIDLLLILISALIGLSICNYLSLPIDWINSYRSILNLTIFKISIDLLSTLRIWIYSNKLRNERLIFQKINNQNLLISLLIMVIIAFLSISMIPYLQIIVRSSDYYLPIYLIALINLSLLAINQNIVDLSRSIFYEFVFSAHLSFSIPLVIIGFAINRAPGFFSLIFFQLFLHFMAINLIAKVKFISQGDNGIVQLKIPIPKILLLHNALIVSGYLMWIIMGLLGLEIRIWVYPMLTIPIGLLSIYQTDKIIKGRSPNFSQAFISSILCNISVLFSLVVALNQG